MKWNAGERITAGRLSITRQWLTASAGIASVTTTATDIPGITHTFTTTRDNVDVEARAVVDAEAIGADPLTGALVVELNVDGVAEGEQLVWNAGTNNTTADGMREATPQQWLVTLTTAGSHTIKLTARRSGGTADDLAVRTTHTNLMLVIEDNV